MLMKRFREPLSIPLGDGKTALRNEATGEYVTDETANAIWKESPTPITVDDLVSRLLVAGNSGKKRSTMYKRLYRRKS